MRHKHLFFTVFFGLISLGLIFPVFSLSRITFGSQEKTDKKKKEVKKEEKKEKSKQGDKDKDKKEKDKPKEDSVYNSGLVGGLKFRSIGPAFTSGRIADFAVNPKNKSE